MSLLLISSLCGAAHAQGFESFNPFQSFMGGAEQSNNDGDLDEQERAHIDGAVQQLAAQFKAQLTEHITEQVRAAKSGESKLGLSKVAPRISELQHAVANNQYEKAVKLLEDGADPNTASPSLMTPLHTAAEAGYKDCADVLLLHNATVNARGPDDATPLHLAALKGRASVTELLLREGADTEARMSSRQQTPLWVACEMGHTRVVTRLLGANASVYATASDGSTPLHMACREGHEQAVELLIEAGGRVDEPDHEGARPMHYAIARQNTAIVQRLLDAGAAAVSEDRPEDAERIAKAAAGPVVKVEVTSKMFTMEA